MKLIFSFLEINFVILYIYIDMLFFLNEISSFFSWYVRYSALWDNGNWVLINLFISIRFGLISFSFFFFTLGNFAIFIDSTFSSRLFKKDLSKKNFITVSWHLYLSRQIFRCEFLAKKYYSFILSTKYATIAWSNPNLTVFHPFRLSLRS